MGFQSRPKKYENLHSPPLGVSQPPQLEALYEVNMQKLNFQSLCFRLTALVTTLCIVSVALVAFSCLSPVEQKMKLVVGDEQYALVSSAANFVSRDIEAKRTLLHSLAEQLAHSRSTTSADLQRLLRTNQALTAEFFNVVIFSKDGELIANMQRDRDVGGFAASHETFFTHTVEHRTSAISLPFRSPFLGEPVVLITQPVLDHRGNIALVLAGGIDLRAPRLLNQLDAVKPGKTGYYFIIDDLGTIIQHPKSERLLVNVHNEAGGPTSVTAAALGGFQGWKEGIAKDGRNSLIAYKRINGTNWLMGAVYPTAEAFSALSEARTAAWIGTAIVAALAGITGLFITRRLLSPLTRLREKVENIADGTANIDVLDVTRTDETGALSRAFFALSQQRHAAERKLADLALTDPLTGIGNRRQFQNVVEFFLARAERNKQSVALAYLDIDKFKTINDNFGHSMGDMVLVEFAHRLQKAVRASDTIARLAGDEFVVVYDTMTDGANVSDFAIRILEVVRDPFELDGKVLTVTTSIGLAFHAFGKTTIDELVQRADEALYVAKRSGRDTFAVANISGNNVVD